jgi:hypothetical protein
MQKSFKALLYIFLMFAIVSDYFSYDLQNHFLYLYLGLIYYDCKEHNIRSLVVIIVFVEFIFYELDYFVYVVSKYYLKTGPIAGDMILNCIILLNMVVLSLSVLYRQEIMTKIHHAFDLKGPSYMPNKADSLILISTRLCTYFYITFFLANALTVYQLINTADPSIMTALRLQLIDDGHSFIKIESTLNSLRYLIIIMLVFPWSRQEQDKSNRFMSF